MGFFFSFKWGDTKIKHVFNEKEDAISEKEGSQQTKMEHTHTVVYG